jgi:hypothetical protein
MQIAVVCIREEAFRKISPFPSGEMYFAIGEKKDGSTAGNTGFLRKSR